jgi:glycosyltransferase involved in cell wall biosynthesis
MVTTSAAFGLMYAIRRASAATPSQEDAVNLWAGKTFGQLVLARGFGRATAVYAYNSAARELLAEARRRQLLTILEQTIAPREVERRLIREEQELFPDWEPAIESNVRADEFCERERAEWELADVIVCASTFVRDGIARCGGPADRCALVPYGVDVVPPPVKYSASSARPLRVLTVGALGLRKGTPYVLEAARQLQGAACFRMVGAAAISPSALARVRRFVEVTGPVPRSEIRRHYAWADVFLLPSLCEGSATAICEALASGLPVVTTPNSGSTVRDGVEGFVVPIRDAHAIAGHLARLASERDVLGRMSHLARLRAGEFSVESYGNRLIAALETATCVRRN